MTDRPNDELAAELRETQEALDGSRVTDRYLEHARNVRAFDADLAARGEPIRAAYRDAGLSYLLARKALWIADLLDRRGEDHPKLWTRGPSVLLLAVEATRRLEREGRVHEVPSLLRDIEAGRPRDATREKYFPVETSHVGKLISALQRGRVERARRLYEALSITERQQFDRFAHATSRLIGAPASIETCEAVVTVAPTPRRLGASTIEGALVALTEGSSA